MLYGAYFRVAGIYQIDERGDIAQGGRFCRIWITDKKTHQFPFLVGFKVQTNI
jgi:hypothetical protein